MMLFGWKCSKIRFWWWLHSFINVLKNIELYILNGRNLWHVNYLLIKLFLKITVIEYSESLFPHSCYILTEGRERGSVQSGQPKTLAHGSSTVPYTSMITKVAQKESGELPTDSQNFHLEVIPISSIHVSLAKEVSWSHSTKERISNFNSVIYLGKEKSWNIYGES